MRIDLKKISKVYNIDNMIVSDVISDYYIYYYIDDYYIETGEDNWDYNLPYKDFTIIIVKERSLYWKNKKTNYVDIKLDKDDNNSIYLICG